MRSFAILPAALFTLAVAVSIHLGAPTRADARTANGASTTKVLSACKNTAGCQYHRDPDIPGYKGNYSGCSSQVCFSCTNGKCVSIPAIKGKTPGKGATIGGVRLPPGTAHPTSGGKGTVVRHPVNVDAPNKPTKVKTPIGVGKAGGPNQSGGHHR